MDASSATSSPIAGSAVASLPRCQLCGHRDQAAAPSTSAQPASRSPTQSPIVSAVAAAAAAAVPDHSDASTPAASPRFRCTRCGLTSTYALADVDDDGALAAEPQSAATMMEAARAYRFTLLSQMSDSHLPRDIASIVVSYLLWYRAPHDFAISDLVDARDLRGDWLLARIEDIQDGKVLIHFLGFSRKWDSWIAVQSNRLAPCHTHPKKKQDATFTAKLACRLSWPKQKGRAAAGRDGPEEAGAERLGATSSSSTGASVSASSGSPPMYVSASAQPAGSSTSAVSARPATAAGAPLPASHAASRSIDSAASASASSSSSRTVAPTVTAAAASAPPTAAAVAAASAAYSVLTRPRPAFAGTPLHR